MCQLSESHKHISAFLGERITGSQNLAWFVDVHGRAQHTDCKSDACRHFRPKVKVQQSKVKGQAVKDKVSNIKTQDIKEQSSIKPLINGNMENEIFVHWPHKAR
jgi:hypothetical protein